MLITEVRIKLMDGDDRHGNGRLLAFASITFDNAFVVRDVKIIDGTRGVFAAMPSRKLTDRCVCGTKNPLCSRFCSACGRQLDEIRALPSDGSRVKLHADIAHPINASCRALIQEAVLQGFYEERERAKQPGYASSYEDWDDTGEEAECSPAVAGHLHAPNNGKHPDHRPSPPTTTSRPQARGAHVFGAGIL